MIDYCLQNANEAEFNQLMLTAGLCVTDGDGNVTPASCDVLVDRIGSITIWNYSVDPPTSVTYPGYYSNVRLMFEPSQEQAAALAPFAIDPAQPQYRVWA